jgi:hypothetical protein
MKNHESYSEVINRCQSQRKNQCFHWTLKCEKKTKLVTGDPFCNLQDSFMTILTHFLYETR